MEEEIVIYFIILAMFTTGSIYNLTIRNRCIYPVKLTKPRLLIMGIIPLIFLGMAYFVSDGSWHNYLLSILASVFLMSSVLGEGIHSRGIYYGTSTRSLIPRLAKWEDIKDIELDVEKNKLKSLKLKAKAIYPDQYYRVEDFDEINKYIKIRMEKN